MNLRRFRLLNDLSQDTIAKYLGINRSYISQVETDRVKLAPDKVDMLLNNEHGWDVTPLIDNTGANISAKATDHSSASVNIGNRNSARPEKKQENHVREIELLKEQIASLKAQLEEAKKEKQTYLEMIQKLMK